MEAPPKDEIAVMTPITREQKLEISNDLEQFHKVFDVFWGLSDVFFVPAEHKVQTAAVCFPPGGKSHMMINTAFWQRLNEDEKLFVIIHECLHVMLDHGLRNARNIPGATPRLINIAQDISINEMIVDMFGFMRGLLRGWRKYCWIETCFKDPKVIERNQVFEYYLRKLIQQGTDPDVELMDEHSDDGGGGYDDGDPDPLAQTLGEYLTFDELQALIMSMGKEGGRGIGASPFNTILENRTPLKVNFNDLVKRLKRNAKAKEFNEAESFRTESRRFQSLGRKMLLPGMTEGKPKKHKLITLVFFDVSGSCMPYLNKLNAVREAFEKEKNLFDVRSYAFDTSVKLVAPKTPLAVGGGTSFDIIEAECQRVMKEDGRYPDCVVIITDGDGNRVTPEYPGRWVWLLTPGGRHTYISDRSRAWPISSVTF